MKPILRQIIKDRKKGYVMSHHHAMMVQSQWLKLYGTGGCDCYPYMSERDIVKDLMEYYKIEDN